MVDLTHDEVIHRIDKIERVAWQLCGTFGEERPSGSDVSDDQVASGYNELGPDAEE